jgi:protein TonB
MAEVSDADHESRGRTSEGPIDVGELPPLNQVPPEYPRRAQRRGLEGYVELAFLVAPDGRVDADSIRVVEARPGNVFDRAARQAVSQWRFEASGQLRRARQRLEFQLR